MKCEYCHEDREGFVRGLDKNCHACIEWSNGRQRLILQFGKERRSTEINFCPMCGRRLNDA